MSIDSIGHSNIAPDPSVEKMARHSSMAHLAGGMPFVAAPEVTFVPTGGATEALEVPAPREADEAVPAQAIGQRVLRGAEHMTEALVEDVTREMQMAAARYKLAVALHPIREPEPGEARQTVVSVAPAAEEVSTAKGWRPAHVFEYSSKDPFHDLNHDLVLAMNGFANTTMAQAERLHPTRDPEFTYLSLGRSRKGRKPTLITKLLIDIDEGMGDWIRHVPDAERLRPVKEPWSDESTIILDETIKDRDVFIEIPQTPAQQVLMGASGDGRGVRERGAWERGKIGKIIEAAKFDNGELTITSLGTGTGEPAVDAGLEAMERKYGAGAFKLRVNGIDLNPVSLKVATHIARHKRTNGVLEFVPRQANLLKRDELIAVVADTEADAYETLGFAEYAASDCPTSDMEYDQRERMRRFGLISAEEYYATIYDNMPKGSVLLTGNMRDDSSQAKFVVNGLGWGNIIQRSTGAFLDILKRGGIPGKAVELYVPGRNSSGVYNLAAITKL